MCNMFFRASEPEGQTEGNFFFKTSITDLSASINSRKAGGGLAPLYWVQLSLASVGMAGYFV